MQYSIRYVNPPKNPDGKYGNLKMADGTTMLMCPVNLLGMFTPNTTVDISTKNETWKGRNGDPDKQMVIVTSGPNGARPTPAQAQAGAAMANPANQAQAAPFISRGNEPSPAEARRMFVSNVVGNAMSSGKFSASELRVLTQGAMEAFEMLSLPATPKVMPKELPVSDGEPFPLQ